MEQKQNNLYLILGWICFGLSLFFIPILFGAGTFIFGYLTRKQSGKETHGVVLMVFAVVGVVVGMISGYVVGSMAAGGY